MSTTSTATADDGSKQDMDVLIDDVHSRCAQAEEVLSQARDRCEDIITAATGKAKGIVEEAEKRTEVREARIATTRT
jgi:vacuolar-type H+-ATPase subunit H